MVAFVFLGGEQSPIHVEKPPGVKAAVVNRGERQSKYWIAGGEEEESVGIG